MLFFSQYPLSGETRPYWICSSKDYGSRLMGWSLKILLGASIFYSLARDIKCNSLLVGYGFI